MQGLDARGKAVWLILMETMGLRQHHSFTCRLGQLLRSKHGAVQRVCVMSVSWTRSVKWPVDAVFVVPQNWFPGGRIRNSTFGRRFIIVSIIIFPSLAIALAVPGKSADIVTATGGAPASCMSCSAWCLCR